MDAPSHGLADRIRLRQAVVELTKARAVLSPSPRVRRTAALEFEVVDVRRLPTELVTITPNETAIRSSCCKNWREGDPLPHVDGVRFRIVWKAHRDPKR